MERRVWWSGQWKAELSNTQILEPVEALSTEKSVEGIARDMILNMKHTAQKFMPSSGSNKVTWTSSKEVMSTWSDVKRQCFCLRQNHALFANIARFCILVVKGQTPTRVTAREPVGEAFWKVPQARKFGASNMFIQFEFHSPKWEFLPMNAWLLASENQSPWIGSYNVEGDEWWFAVDSQIWWPLPLA